MPNALNFDEISWSIWNQFINKNIILEKILEIMHCMLLLIIGIFAIKNLQSNYILRNPVNFINVIINLFLRFYNLEFKIWILYIYYV